MTMALRWKVLGSWAAFSADRWVRSTSGMIVLWTVLGFTAMRMDNFAHGGGLLTGAVLGAVFVGTSTRPTAVKLAALGAFTLALLALLAAAAHRWPGEKSVWEDYQNALRNRGTDAT